MLLLIETKKLSVLKSEHTIVTIPGEDFQNVPIFITI